MIFQKLAGSHVDNTGTGCFQDALLASGNIVGDVGEEALQWEDRVEFCDVDKHALSLSPAPGKPSLPLLQQLWCTSSPRFMAPISTPSGKSVHYNPTSSHSQGCAR